METRAAQLNWNCALSPLMSLEIPGWEALSPPFSITWAHFLQHHEVMGWLWTLDIATSGKAASDTWLCALDNSTKEGDRIKGLGGNSSVVFFQSHNCEAPYRRRWLKWFLCEMQRTKRGITKARDILYHMIMHHTAIPSHCNLCRHHMEH